MLVYSRRQIYGDTVLGQSNLRMVEIGRTYGSAAKFPGSGGAVVGLCLDANKRVCVENHFIL